VRPQGLHKGSVIRKILARETGVDFILCIGDDKTDEDMFEEVNKPSEVPFKFSIAVEKKTSQATHHVDNQRHVVDLLSVIAYS